MADDLFGLHHVEAALRQPRQHEDDPEHRTPEHDHQHIDIVGQVAGQRHHQQKRRRGQEQPERRADCGGEIFKET